MNGKEGKYSKLNHNASHGMASIIEFNQDTTCNCSQTDFLIDQESKKIYKWFVFF